MQVAILKLFARFVCACALTFSFANTASSSETTYPEHAAVGSAVQDQRMNIVIITADDLGFQLGCYDDKIATTPNIDAFAASCCKFTNGYVVQASCSPSRAAILTGLYPHQHGQVANVLPALPSTGLLPYQMKPGIDTLPSILKRIGYFTGIIGKLHVEPSTAFNFNFKALGPARSRDPQLLLQHLTDFDAKRGTQPFFLMLNIFDPHKPMLRDISGIPQVKVDFGQVSGGFPFNTDRSPESLSNVADYYTCVNRLDDLMGRVHAFFRRETMAEQYHFCFRQ